MALILPAPVRTGRSRQNGLTTPTSPENPFTSTRWDRFAKVIHCGHLFPYIVDCHTLGSPSVTSSEFRLRALLAGTSGYCQKGKMSHRRLLALAAQEGFTVPDANGGPEDGAGSG
ncbi:hypothetical protein NXC12_CH01828 [Rhizobium etli]|uniref:Uncharacterized protein n=1 Tax=Rhizobium etli TaxID=29449 RepID=A0AAN1BEU6_RHIET|nr:hypothetical protein NXC12_CH01828 [Rhizobium etli]